MKIMTQCTLFNEFLKETVYCYIDDAMIYLYLLFFICDLSTVFTEFTGTTRLLQLKIQIPVEAFVQTFDLFYRPRCSHSENSLCVMTSDRAEWFIPRSESSITS